MSDPAIELTQRHEDLPALRRPALRDAEERAAAAQHPARSAAERDVSGAAGRLVHGAGGSDVRRHRPERIGQEHGAQARRRHHEADERHRRPCSGRISALIELGAGFHPEISGRENVFINGIMLGLTKREIQQRFDEIVEFAELRDFIDAPVKTYSSGMYMRLGLRRRDSRRSRRAARGRSARGRRRGLHAQVPRQVRASSSGAARRSCSSRTRSGSSSGSATRRSGSTRARSAREGDPKRVDRRVRHRRRAAGRAVPGRVGRQGEARCRASPARASPPRPGATPGEVAADMSQRRPRAAGDRAASRSRTSRSWTRSGQPTHVFHTGEPLTVRFKVRAAKPVQDFVFGVGHLQRRRRLRLRHQHGHRGVRRRFALRATPTSAS